MDREGTDCESVPREATDVSDHHQLRCSNCHQGCDPTSLALSDR